MTAFTVEVTLRPGMLPAVQYTCFPLSDLDALIDSDDKVVIKPYVLFIIVDEIDWLVMSFDGMNHVMLAGGLQYDVIQVIFICCFAVTVICVGVIFTNVTGATVI